MLGDTNAKQWWPIISCWLMFDDCFWSVKLKVALVRRCDMMMTLFFWFWWKKVEKFPSWYYILNDKICVWTFCSPECFFSNVSQTVQNIESRCHELYLLCYHLEKRRQIPLRSGRCHFSPVIHTGTPSYIISYIYIIYISIFWCFHCISLWLRSSHLANHLIKIYPTKTQRPNSLDLTSWYVGRESRHKI